MAKTRVLSIEIGYTMTTICDMDYRVKNPKIYKCVSFPTPKGAIEDGFLNEEVDLAFAVKRALATKKIKTKQAVFSIASSKIATREVMLPAVKMNQVDALVRANAADYFPIDLTEYELAHLVLGVVKEEDKSEKYRVLVMAAGKNLISGYERFAEKCGLHLLALDYSGNSIFQLMRNECTEDTEMVIKLDEHSAIVTIISEKNFVLQRNVVYGVDDAVNALLRSGIYKEKEYADIFERMKQEPCIRAALSDDTLMLEEIYDFDENEEITGAKKAAALALAPLISNVSRVVDFYNTKNPTHPITLIRLGGYGSDVNGLDKLFTNELGIRTVTMPSLKNVSWAHGINEPNAGRFINSIGATVAPVGFVNEEKKKNERKNVNYINTAVLIGIFFVVASAALSTLALEKYNLALAQQVALKGQEAQYAQGEAVWNNYNSMTEFYHQVEAVYRQTQHPNDGLIAFLEELEEKLPTHSELTEFSSDDKEAILTIRVKDKEQAAKVIQTLRDFDSVRDVSIGVVDREEVDKLKNQENPEYRTVFSIICSYYTTSSEEQATE